MAELFLGGIVDPATHERTGDDVRLPSADLTTHGVIVGMTGSGKTGLGVVLVEEVLRSGRPALLIDPKGDLTNLALTFPELAPGDLRPWVDEGAARAAGMTPDELAGRESAAWREGLGRWGHGRDDIAALRAAADVTIYTPGSRAGVPLNVVGSLDVPATTDPEVVGDEIDGYVSGLLGLVGIEADPLASREHILLANLVAAAWSRGVALDLPTLVGQVQSPPIRKLGVFELEQFFPAAERRTLAVALNGLLASPSFEAWGAGAPLDIDALLHGPDGRPRCAIVTTAHLADAERQFVTALVLSKVITWMRGQSGTSELRALLYLDEVAGYLPPTAAPPTKRPILTLMKQARAFGVGVVLATQNPVDIDYKALSNAGTWMVGRLQTERDQQRLLAGMSVAAGTVDVRAVGTTISGLGRREFVLRRAGHDEPEVFTTRWAMSYLRGPMTRDQIARLTAAATPSPAAAAAGRGAPLPPPTGPAMAAGAPVVPVTEPDTTPLMPTVARTVPVRWVDPAAPWLTAVGADPTSTTYAPAVVARVALHYDEARADLAHDEEYEAVLHPLGDHVDVTAAITVDHDPRDLREAPPAGIAYRLTGAPIGEAAFWRQVSKDLVDHLTRTRAIEIPCNRALKLYGRPGESTEAFAARCADAAADAADTQAAALRDKYAAKMATLDGQIDAAADAAAVADDQHRARRHSDLVTSAGSILGGLLGGRRRTGGLLGQVGRAAGRRSKTTAAGSRVDAARNKVARLEARLRDIEDELTDELLEIDARWRTAAAGIETLAVGLERTDVKVTQLVLAWLPAP